MNRDVKDSVLSLRGVLPKGSHVNRNEYGKVCVYTELSEAYAKLLVGALTPERKEKKCVDCGITFNALSTRSRRCPYHRQLHRRAVKVYKAKTEKLLGV